MTVVTLQFVKVEPFNYKGKTFTIKPLELVKSVKEINVKDHIRNMKTARANILSNGYRIGANTRSENRRLVQEITAKHR